MMLPDKIKTSFLLVGVKDAFIDFFYLKLIPVKGHSQFLFWYQMIFLLLQYLIVWFNDNDVFYKEENTYYSLKHQLYGYTFEKNIFWNILDFSEILIGLSAHKLLSISH